MDDDLDFEAGGGAGGKKRVRIVWTKEEDDVLREVVASIGTHNWSEVARQFMEVARERGVCKAERNGKSCRIRWSNQLDTGLDFTPFTKQEERVIIQAHAQLGNRWKQIASLLPGRTDNMVKNFWYRKLRHNHSQSGNTSGNTPDHSGVRPSRSDEALTSQHAEPLSSGGGPAVEAPATGGRRPRGSYGGRKSVDLPGDLHAVQRTGKGLESIRKRRSSLGAGTTEQIQREVLGTDSAESVRLPPPFLHSSDPNRAPAGPLSQPVLPADFQPSRPARQHRAQGGRSASPPPGDVGMGMGLRDRSQRSKGIETGRGIMAWGGDAQPMAHPRRRAGSLEIPSDRVGPRNPAQRAYTAKEEINEDILAQFESFLYDTDAATAGIAAAPSGSTVPLPEGLPYPGFPPLQDPPAFPSRDSGLFSSPKGAPPPTSLPWHLAAHLARFGGVGARDRELFAPGGGRDSGGASGLGSGRGGMMRGPVGGGTAADVAMLEAGTGRLSLQTPDDAPRGGATLSTAELLGVRGAARAGMPSELFMRGSDIASMRTSDAPGRRGLDEGLDLLRAAGSEDVPLGMSDPLEGIEDPRVWGATEKRGSGSRAPSGKQGPEELEVHSEEEQRRMRDAAQQYLEALGRIGSDKSDGYALSSLPASTKLQISGSRQSGSAQSVSADASWPGKAVPHPSLPPGKGADDEGFWANMGGDTSLLAELPRFSLPSVGMSLGEEPPTLSMPEDLPRKQ